MCRWYAMRLLAKLRRTETDLTSDIDVVTGLLTAPALQAQIEAQDELGALVHFDLDKFKAGVNNRVGQERGDEILRTVGSRLVELVGDDGLVGRPGADEFDVFLLNADAEQFVADALAAIREPIRLTAPKPENCRGPIPNVVELSCSAGIACAPANGVTFDELRESSRHGLRLAREAGGDQAMQSTLRRLAEGEVAAAQATLADAVARLAEIMAGPEKRSQWGHALTEAHALAGPGGSLAYAWLAQQRFAVDGTTRSCEEMITSQDFETYDEWLNAVSESTELSAAIFEQATMLARSV